MFIDVQYNIEILILKIYRKAFEMLLSQAKPNY